MMIETKEAKRVEEADWVGILTDEKIGDQVIYTLEYSSRMNAVTGPSIEGVVDAANEAILWEQITYEHI